MWKFLRKYYRHVDGTVERMLRAHQEFGIDIWYSGVGLPLPCFSARESAWRSDVTVDVAHETRGNRRHWVRTIHTPEGDLHDEKRAMIIAEGSGTGPEIVEPLVKDVSRDLPLLRYMHPDPGAVDFAGAWETDRKIGDRGLLVASIYSPIDCRDAMRPDAFMMLYHDDREAFREIVDIGAAAMMRETLAVLEAGFKVLQTWWFYASPSYGWSPQIYEEMFLPHLVRHVELVHRRGAIYVYYDDGRMHRFMDMYVEAGVDCLMTLTPPPMGDVDPREAKRRYGERVALMGGIDAVNEVYLSNPGDIRNMVRDRLEVYAPGGGYIMDGSNSLVYETPLENVRALADAGREFGAY